MSVLRNIERINMAGGAARVAGQIDPSAVGLALPEGSMYHRNQPGAGELWVKFGAADTEWVQVSADNGFDDLFEDVSGSPMKARWTQLNGVDLPITQTAGRMRADVQDNTGERTLWFNADQGRLDYQVVTFPFTIELSNIGIGQQGDSQAVPVPGVTYPELLPWNFCGAMIHVLNPLTVSYRLLTAGHRGSFALYTLEAKNTLAGASNTVDGGTNLVPSGRVDMQIIGASPGNTVVFNYRQVGDLIWLPAPVAPFNNPEPFAATALFGPATYTFLLQSMPFVGTCDGIVMP